MAPNRSMQLQALLTTNLVLWPDVIDLSDGHYTPLSGFCSQNLIAAYNAAEHQAASLGEWPELMVWVIYQQLHQLAQQAFSAQHYQLQRDTLQQHLHAVHIALLNNLRMPGYEDMLVAYLTANEVP